MAEEKPKGRAAKLRSILLLVAVGLIGFFVWRHYTHREGYTGGDVTTTGTVEAVHVDLGFKVPGRIAEIDVTEGDDVRPGQLVGRLETQDLDGEVMAARAGLEAAKAALAQARANHQKSVRDLARQRDHAAVVRCRARGGTGGRGPGGVRRGAGPSGGERAASGGAPALVRRFALQRSRAGLP